MRNDDTKEILCCEYNAISNHMSTGWQISYTLLAAAIGAFGVIVFRSIALIDPASKVHVATSWEWLFAYLDKCLTGKVKVTATNGTRKSLKLLAASVCAPACAVP